MPDWLTAYATLKFVHVLLAIVAVGANATYGIWMARASRRPEILPQVLRTIRFLDDRVANPSYGLLLLTGLGLAWIGRLSLRTPWIVTGIVLYAIMAVLGIALYRPALRKQIDALDRHGFASRPYRVAAARGTAFGIATSIPAILIVAVMVLKPG